MFLRYVGTGHAHGVEGPTIQIGVCSATQLAAWMGVPQGTIFTTLFNKIKFWNQKMFVTFFDKS